MGYNKYQKLLKKIYLVELLGRLFYQHMASRETDKGLRTIYQELSNNEHMAALCIAKDMGEGVSGFSRFYIYFLAKLFSYIIRIVPKYFLIISLQNLLKRRIYSKWFKVYYRYNMDLWKMLLEHEQIQREVLLSWNKKRGGVYGQRKDV